MGNKFTKIEEDESQRDIVLTEDDMDMRSDPNPDNLDPIYEKIMKENKQKQIEKYGLGKRVRAIKLTADGFLSLEYIELVTTCYDVQPKKTHHKCERCGKQYQKLGGYGQGIRNSNSTCYGVYIRGGEHEFNCDLPKNEYLVDTRHFKSYNLRCHMYFVKKNAGLLSMDKGGTEVDCTQEDLKTLEDEIKKSFYYQKQDYYGNYEFLESGALWQFFILQI